jgi:hypothetical protein
MPATLQVADIQEAFTTSVSETDITVAKPTNLADGDWIVLLSGDGGCGACTNEPLVGPTGFTEDLQAVEALTDTFRLGIWSKYIESAAAETATDYTIDLGQAQNGGSSAIACRISGADCNGWIDQLGTYASGQSTTVAANGITASSTGKLILRFAGASNQNGGLATNEWTSHDADFTEASEVGGTGGSNIRRFSSCLTYDAENASTTVDDTGSTVQARSFVPGQTSWIAVMVEVADFTGPCGGACCSGSNCPNCNWWHQAVIF